MQNEIVGEQFQWLKIKIESEKIKGAYQNLLCKSSTIDVGSKNVFSGTGELIFCGNGKIRELRLGTEDSIILNESCILAADVETGQESLSASYVSLVQFFGPGAVFICAKDFVEFYLDESETAEVRTQCLVAMDDTVTFHLGSIFSDVTGPGAVLLETVISPSDDTEKPGTESLKNSIKKALDSEKEEKFSIFDQL